MTGCENKIKICISDSTREAPDSQMPVSDRFIPLLSLSSPLS
jgi:hypothetical protein